MSRHKKIISAVLIIFFSIYSFLSLISFNILQETSNSYSISVSHNVNWGGFAGGVLANYLLTLFGIGAFIFVFFLFISGILLAMKNISKLRTFSGITVLFFAFILFLEALFSRIFYHNFAVSGGGLTGYTFYSGLERFFGTAGTIIIILLLFLASFYILFKSTGLKGLGKIFLGSYALLKNGFEKMGQLSLTKVFGGFKWLLASMKLNLDKKRSFNKRKKTFTENRELFGSSREGIIKELNGKAAAGETQGEPNESEQVKEKDVYFDFTGERETKLPPISLLDINKSAVSQKQDKSTLLVNAALIEKKLLDFGVKGKVTGINPGPIITMYEFEPASGVKIGKILSLSEDLTMALKSKPVRITGVIEGKSAVGIEVPNNKRETVYFSDMANSKEFLSPGSLLTIILGKNTVGENMFFDLRRCPHLLIAGATGAGKSVFINSLIMSLLFKATYEELNFIMIDPKRLELTPYENLPHLVSEVIYDSKKASTALRWAVSEMERRYRTMQDFSVKSIDQYNDKAEEQNLKRMPYLVIIIDELSDLMLTSPKDIETSIIRLSQMARACGIHLVIATQRPSVNVVTGVIKANMPSRVAFLVSSRIDSRTILDSNGAEELLGNGDMLFMPPGQGRLKRIHGSFITEEEIKNVLDFISEKKFPPQKNESLINEFDNVVNFDRMITDDPDDEIYGEVANMVESMEENANISISYIQRRFRIGFNRAARIMEKLQGDGILNKKGKRKGEI